MRCLLQRVSKASVTVDGKVHGKIGPGLVVLVCTMRGDTCNKASHMSGKVVRMRIFRDDDGRMNRSVVDVAGEVMVISQFTLAGNVSRGNRPSFIDAAPPGEAIPVYEHFISQLREHGLEVTTGVFGAEMEIALVNDGPVTIWVEN